jgi:hypothetical protein
MNGKNTQMVASISKRGLNFVTIMIKQNYNEAKHT